MAQCSVCLKLFASKRYLTSHLFQSQKCLDAMTPGDRLPSTNTLHGSRPSQAIINESCSQENSEIIPSPVLEVNVWGDVILADDSSKSSNGFPPPGEDDMVSTTLHENNSLITQVDIPFHDPVPVDVIVSTAPATIHPLESFNVPPLSYDKDIPQFRIMQLVRKYGAPLKMVGEFSKILKEEYQRNRLDITALTTHQTGIRRLQKVYPQLPSPTTVTITHERTVKEMNSGANRPSLTFPVFSFLGQLNDLLNDHVFLEIQNLVVDPTNRWD